MGKGDRKTAKGKRYNSSYGNSRSHAAGTTRTAGTATASAAKKTATKATKTARKTVAKKAAAK